MNTTPACRCIITLSLLNLSVSIQTAAGAASAPSGKATVETRKASPGGMTDAAKTTPGRTTPTDKDREAPVMPGNRAQEVEERVRSGQIDQPTAQGEISERLNRLEAESDTFL